MADAEQSQGFLRSRAGFVVINLVGGPTVLGSYAWGAMAAAQGVSLWGGIPAAVQPFYVANMFLAAAGYFLFSHYILRELVPEKLSLPGGRDLSFFSLAYIAILFPSALWLPLTRHLIEAPGVVSWAAVLAVLWLVAAGSLGVLWGVVRAEPRASRRGRLLAIAGGIAFCMQTVLLDAVIWPVFFQPWM